MNEDCDQNDTNSLISSKPKSPLQSGGYIAIHDEPKAVDLAKTVLSQQNFSSSRIMSGSSLCGKTYMYGRTSSYSAYRPIKSKHNLTDEEYERLQRIESLQTEWNTIREKDTDYIQKRLEYLDKKAENDLISKIREINDEQCELRECKKTYEANDDYELKRSQQLCKEWNKEIFQPIQSRIQDTITPEKFDTLHETRYNIQMKFAQGKEISNNESQLLNQTIKIHDLKDPIKKDLYKYDFEKKLINGGKLKNSIMKPVTKSTLNPINYRHNDHLPHGKDEKILQKLMSMKIPISQTQQKVITNHYKLDRSQNTVKNQYFPGGRKILRVPGTSTFAFDKL